MALYLNGEIDNEIIKRKIPHDKLIVIDNLHKYDENRLDYEKKIFVKNLSQKNHTCNNNLVLLLFYLKENGYPVENNKHFINILNNPLSWSALKDTLSLFSLVEEHINDKCPRFFETIAKTASEKDITFSIFNVLMRFVNIRFIYETVPIFNRNYNNDRTFQYITSYKKNKKLKLLFLTKYFSNFTDDIDFKHEFWMAGILSSISKKRGLNHSEINFKYFEFDLLDILNRLKHIYGFNYKEKNNCLFINDKLYAKKVIVKKETVKCNYSIIYSIFNSLITKRHLTKTKNIYSLNTIELDSLSEESLNKILNEKKSIIVYKMIDDLRDEKKSIILKKDELYGLPYTLFEIVVDLSKKETKRDLKLDYKLLDSQLATLREKFQEIQNEKDRLEEIVLEKTKDLQKAKDQIEQKEKQKTIAFTNIFHEIKTPLTLISNYVEKHIKNYGASEEIKIARDNIDKLKRDILNALDFEKLDKEMIFYDHSQITDISEIVRMNIFMYKELALRKNIQVKFDMQENIYTKIDKNSIDSVINNLIDNAIKYTSNNGMINITLKADNKDIELIISDTGIGISKEDKKNIFKPYYQISHNKSNLQGIGMGLNIVKKIISEVKGDIKVESDKNKGTTFIIKLKRYYLKKDDKIETVNKDKKYMIDLMNIKLKESEYKNDKDNLFVVEDNIQMLSYLQESLYDKYNFYYAKNGIEALEKVEKIPKPELIISDIMMDEMDGYNFFDELKKKDKKYKSIPFIFLTAKTAENEKIKGLKKGAVDYIYKPFSIEELLAKIESIIKNEKIKRENEIIELADEFRSYMLNKTNNKLLKDRENKDKEIYKNTLDSLYREYRISKREIEVLNLLFKGFMRKEIAYELNITMGTVKTYMRRIFTKCNVKSKKELLNVFNIKK